VLISEVWAQSAASAQSAQGIDFMAFMPFVFLIAVFYFILIRPQMKRTKEHKTMLEALQKGDEIVAAGGLVGRVTKIDENYITMQVADGVEVRVQRPSLQLVLPKGTIKGIE
jgi:preprotein translocase subunit YajC